MSEGLSEPLPRSKDIIPESVAQSVMQEVAERLSTIVLRDQFAMAALPVLLKGEPFRTPPEAAESAYDIADAMLAERRKRQKEGQ